jgi:hypothetical protein
VFNGEVQPFSLLLVLLGVHQSPFVGSLICFVVALGLKPVVAAHGQFLVALDPLEVAYERGSVGVDSFAQ